VNDTLGHPAGDALLKEFAARLRGAVRATDTVARLGGDEFVVLLEDVKDQDCAGRVAEKLMTECRRPFVLEEGEIVASASAGLVCGGGGADAEVLLRRADNALYEAKRAGRDQYRVAPG
jgi:diguanylate cyclase (GGDEF)-like protein